MTGSHVHGVRSPRDEARERGHQSLPRGRRGQREPGDDVLRAAVEEAGGGPGSGSALSGAREGGRSPPRAALTGDHTACGLEPCELALWFQRPHVSAGQNQGVGRAAPVFSGSRGLSWALAGALAGSRGLPAPFCLRGGPLPADLGLGGPLSSSPRFPRGDAGPSRTVRRSPHRQLPSVITPAK